MPPDQEVRKTLIEKLLADLPEDAETLRVQLRGTQERLPVIRVPVDSVVLNPKSHRIRSQLESSPEATEAIEANPESEEAQDFIQELLQATPRFEDLKGNLKTEGQLEPGIATQEGRLINGNTRAAALRNIGKEYIEVGILPAATTLAEIYDLELGLQVAEDFRQDYSFTNTLLFVNDLIVDSKLNQAEVAERLRWSTSTKPRTVAAGRKKVDQYVRHLSLIREIQEDSRKRVPLTDFDDQEQALQEYDEAYQKKQNKNPTEADQLKNARVLGMITDLGYDRLRQVDAKWVENYLSEAFEESDILRPIYAGGYQFDSTPPSGGDNDDLGDIDEFENPPADKGSASQRMVGVLLESLLRTDPDGDVKLSNSEGKKSIRRPVLHAAVNEAMRAAAEEAKQVARAGNALQVPANSLSAAAKNVSRATTSYQEVRGRTGLDEAAVEEALNSVDLALKAFKNERKV